MLTPAGAGGSAHGHRLRSRRPLPGAGAAGDGFELRWRGTAVMGVVNVTPDSFSDGGRFDDEERAVAHGLALRRAGAWALDIGGESTRPGAEPVPVALELERVVPVVRRLAAACDALLSVDTRKAEVARAAVEAGAHLVNDVGGLRDPRMLAACAELGVPAVVMHMQGEPRTMQHEPHYHDVLAEVEAFLLERAAAALAAGVPSLLLDPGIGFGKTLEHNLTLLRGLERLAGHGHPLLLGASRKRFIGALGGVDTPADRDAGTLAVHLFGAARGVAVVRSHDVAGQRQALRVWEALGG